MAGVSQEVRYKLALCLLSRGREREAEQQLTQLAGEEGDRWPPLAAVQIWIRWLRQNRFDQAETVFDSLANQYRVEQICRLVPPDLSDQIMDAYTANSRHFSYFRPKAEQVGRCRRALEIAALVAPGWVAAAKFEPDPGLPRTGQEKKALQFADDLYREGPMLEGVADYGWMLCLAGRRRGAWP